MELEFSVLWGRRQVKLSRNTLQQVKEKHHQGCWRYAPIFLKLMPDTMAPSLAEAMVKAVLKEVTTYVTCCQNIFTQ